MAREVLDGGRSAAEASPPRFSRRPPPRGSPSNSFFGPDAPGSRQRPPQTGCAERAWAGQKVFAAAAAPGRRGPPGGPIGTKEWLRRPASVERADVEMLCELFFFCFFFFWFFVRASGWQLCCPRRSSFPLDRSCPRPPTSTLGRGVRLMETNALGKMALRQRCGYHGTKRYSKEPLPQAADVFPAICGGP